MIDFLEDIYQGASTILTVKKNIERIKRADTLIMQTKWVSDIELINAFLEKALELDSDLARELSLKIKKAYDYAQHAPMDLIKMGDELEEAIPLMYRIMEVYGQIDVTEGDIRFFSSKSGALTVENVSTGKYRYSAIDPFYQAYQLAKKEYLPQKTRYNIMGVDLGYLPWQIFECSERSADIYIYELNETNIKYAEDFGTLSYIDSEKLHIVVESDPVRLIDAFFKDSERYGESLGYYWSDRLVDDLPEELKTEVIGFIAAENTGKTNGQLAQANYYRNIVNIRNSFNDLKKTNYKKDWMVIAAGPSFDEQVETIKKKRDAYTVVAVTTIVRRLLDSGIKPDIIVLLDSMEGTYGHIKGLEDIGIPMVIYECAYWKYAEKYTGPKYLLRKSDVEESGKNLLLGSTVSIMAACVAIMLGAEKIELYGLDLAYPGLKSHASGTVHEREMSDTGLIQVDAVCGGTVGTSLEFTVYINEIKELIKNNPKVEFINYSSQGALLKGAKWYKEK